MENRVALYIKINEDVKQRALVYITESKLLNRKTHTMSNLVEEAVDEYLINHS